MNSPTDERTYVVELQRLLTRFPALNPETGGRGEWEKARALEDHMHRSGFPAAVHCDTPDSRVPEGSRPNFYLRLEGRERGPCIWVMMHLDVVPPGERLEDGAWKGWESDPFELRVDGDALYGRGVEDNQQAIVASTLALRRLIRTQTQPPNDINLLFVSAEETGSEYGLKYLLKEHPELFSSDDLILVPDGGNEDGTLIEVAEKSVLWLNFHVQGRQTHGSTPHLGNNAFRAMCAMVGQLDRSLHERFVRKDGIYRPEVSTFEPTRHGGSVPNVNTVPGEETFSFDCRVLPVYRLDDVLDAVREVAAGVDADYGSSTTVGVENRLDAPEPTDDNAPVVRALQRALKRTRGLDGEPRGLGGSTVAALFRQAGFPAVVWSTVEGVGHQVNERAHIPNILADADVLEYIFRHGRPSN